MIGIVAWNAYWRGYWKRRLEIEAELRQATELRKIGERIAALRTEPDDG